ncbi:MAG: DUF927 domain-containing protein [Ruminococcus flavefaciens]|nr:DUF927 domain-containing protein [Ruminococcus flavefaciens]
MDYINTIVNATEDKSENMLIKVINVTDLVDANNIEVTLLIGNRIKKKHVMVTLLRTDISPGKIRQLVLRNGGICRDAKQICNDITAEVDNMLIKGIHCMKHNTIGWTTYEDVLVFNADVIYAKKEVIHSKYSGKYNIVPTGSPENIGQLFEECLLDNVPMAAVMCMAAAATVLPFANRMWGVTIYNPTNHLLGNSTTGKTTAALLFAAFGGSPIENGGFFMTFMGTDNGIMKAIGNNCGYPCVIDEFSTSMSRKKWTDFIYTLADGNGKLRCGAGGSKVQEVEHWETVFLTTGEMSILRKCNRNEGIRARLFEYQIESWTRSAEEADKIKNIAKNNYGLLTPMIAKELLANGADWLAGFENWRKRIKNKIHADKLLLGIGDRVADVVALYMIACEILGHVLNISMSKESMDAIFEFFYLHIIIKNADEANLGMRAYEELVAYFSRNRHLFPEESLMMPDGYYMGPDTEGFTMRSRKGKTIDGKKYNTRVIFLPEVVEAVLVRRGFSDPKVAMKEAKKAGYLRTKDKSRLIWTLKINGIDTNVYAVWVDSLI